ncbi:DUF1894 domain-containing protein [Methanococcoides alaskense]|uniref:DUF1894 domain-containing protein n=1 Tax=Methanococcoides alaskense TaxID=325778 RepID=A0AA90TYP5_9EURY|nr:DUF1894 domain-containing protein [Methanococcoides alaskense]MDA0524687.1 DUF1894 domain-containing protein [Methanococcoides alaskense]MDR6222386.1 hypothetical protein [Methanococcoides alaskense]
MSCINDIPYEILLKGATPKECEDFIKKECDEVYHVKGGYKLHGIMLRGGDSIPIGIKGDDLIFQFIKPCSGLYILRYPDAKEDIEQLRNSQK